MNTVAYEMITTRLSHYSAEKLAKYEPVMLDTDGKYAKADGTGPFIGVVEYGVDGPDEMVTIVKGIYPIIAGADIAAGAKLAIDAGTVITADNTDSDVIVIGAALAAATEGNLVSVQMFEPYVLVEA